MKIDAGLPSNRSLHEDSLNNLGQTRRSDDPGLSRGVKRPGRPMTDDILTVLLQRKTIEVLSKDAADEKDSTLVKAVLNLLDATFKSGRPELLSRVTDPPVSESWLRMLRTFGREELAATSNIALAEFCVYCLSRADRSIVKNSAVLQALAPQNEDKGDQSYWGPKGRFTELQEPEKAPMDTKSPTGPTSLNVPAKDGVGAKSPSPSRKGTETSSRETPFLPGKLKKHSK